jgi:acyl carrier protein
MERSNILTTITDVVNRLRRQNGLDAVEVCDDSSLLDGSLGIDSLDLAALVVELDETLANGTTEFDGRPVATVGQLAAIYAQGA